MTLPGWLLAICEFHCYGSCQKTQIKGHQYHTLFFRGFKLAEGHHEQRYDQGEAKRCAQRDSHGITHDWDVREAIFTKLNGERYSDPKQYVQ